MFCSLSLSYLPKCEMLLAVLFAFFLAFVLHSDSGLDLIRFADSGGLDIVFRSQMRLFKDKMCSAFFEPFLFFDLICLLFWICSKSFFAFFHLLSFFSSDFSLLVHSVCTLLSLVLIGQTTLSCTSRDGKSFLLSGLMFPQLLNYYLVWPLSKLSV